MIRLRPDVPKDFQFHPLELFVTDIRQQFGTIILFGVTKNENSVQLKVNEWYNFFCVKLPNQVSFTDFENAITSFNCYHWKVIKIDRCEGSDLIGYYPDELLKDKFCRLHYNTKSRTGLSELKTTLTELNVKGVGVFDFSPFYDDSPAEKQFLIDTSINTGSWISIRADSIKYNKIEEGKIYAEANIEFIKILKRDDVPVLYILSFDIECQGGRVDKNGKSIFPEPQHDPIITIGNYVYKLGTDEPVLERGFQLGSIDNENETMLSFNDERELLLQWFEFVKTVDPDIFESFNGTNFDFPYIINRAKHFNLSPVFGRDDDRPVTCYEKKGSTMRTAHRMEWSVQIYGRINWDVYKICFANEKLSRYTLNFISQTFINNQKIDLSYTDINKFQDEGPTERRMILDYCMKDCALPHAISLKKMYFIRYIELARVSMTPIEWLIHRGQAIKCSIQIRHMAKLEQKFVKDYVRQKSTEQYEGAIVLEPRRGLYSSGPVTTCDFNSLYPNIMRSKNLCYTTYIKKDDIENLHPDLYHRTPNGEFFVNKDVKEGLICRLVANLLEARKKAKIDMYNAQTKEIQDIMNARQLGLKLCANSGTKIITLSSDSFSKSISKYNIINCFLLC